MAATALEDQVKLVISAAVDAAFYREVYADLEPTLHPASHYTMSGWREGRDPAPWFSTSAYLAANADVAEAGVNPFHHYLVAGRREGRVIARSQHASAYFAERLKRRELADWTSGIAPADRRELAPAERLSPQLRAEVTKGFDEAFYRGANPDLTPDQDALDHFLTSGWREGRDPSPTFSVNDYLDAYPDIASAGVNPFIHYLTTGRSEGRAPRLDLGFRFALIANLEPVEARAAAAAEASAGVARQDAATLAGGFAISRSGWRDLHVTFSHDDYSTNLGGVQICLQREAARFEALGRDHLHLFPSRPWPVLRGAGDPGPLGVLWNGEALGDFEASAIVSAVRESASAVTAGARSFAIHSLLGHDGGETAEIVEAAGLRDGFFWLHDFASICSGVHLLRNDVEDCGAPAPDSPACSICAYLPLRRRHIEAHETLFRRLRLTVAAPSQTTLDTWRAAWTFPAAREIVHPHARLVKRNSGRAPPGVAGRPFQFAFVGLPAVHKGWPVFRELALKFGDDPRYAFLHLGVRTERGLPVEHHQVAVGESAPLAMQSALEKLGVDAAMVWPLCRETFSFTAYEAAASGAAVVTGPDSGNVAAFVEATGFGWVLADEGALEAAFESGEILRLSRAARRAKPADLIFSGLTADLAPGRAGS